MHYYAIIIIMKFLVSTLLFTFSISSFAFMSGIDPSRDTQGEIDIIGATIPLAPPNASVNAGYVKFSILLIKMLNFIVSLVLFTIVLKCMLWSIRVVQQK